MSTVVYYGNRPESYMYGGVDDETTAQARRAGRPLEEGGGGGGPEEEWVWGVAPATAR